MTGLTHFLLHFLHTCFELNIQTNIVWGLLRLAPMSQRQLPAQLRKLPTAVCVDLAKLEGRKPKPQNQLLLFAKCEPKSCAHECNYVVRLPIQPVKEVYHVIIIIHVHSFLVHILQGERKPL